MVLDAIEMARWSRGARHEDLRCHSDAGSQFTSIRCGERLAETGATPSIGTVGDSYDNALAETVNGYYKAELVRGPARPAVEDLELATLGYRRKRYLLLTSLPYTVESVIAAKTKIPTVISQQMFAAKMSEGPAIHAITLTSTVNRSPMQAMRTSPRFKRAPAIMRR